MAPPLESQDCSTTALNVYDGFQYRISHDGRTFDGTRTYCQSLGGDMAIITSAEQNNFIATLLDMTGYYFLGLEDMDNDDTYKWIDGTISGYASWDHPLNENNMWVFRPYCAVITYYERSSGNYVRGMWNRVACTSQRRNICQIPLVHYSAQTETPLPTPANGCPKSQIRLAGLLRPALGPKHDGITEYPYHWTCNKK
nr:C-type lectin domain family 4 member C-like [Lytechinus pictus]